MAQAVDTLNNLIREGKVSTVADHDTRKHKLFRAVLKTAKRHGKVYKKLAMDTDTAKTIKRHGKVYKKLFAGMLKGKHSPEGKKYLAEEKKKK